MGTIVGSLNPINCSIISTFFLKGEQNINLFIAFKAANLNLACLCDKAYNKPLLKILLK